MAEKALKSDIFQWEGKDKKGNKVKGEISGTSAPLVRAQLRSQGITADKVKKKPKPLFGGAGKKIKPLDIALFTRQMATMMAISTGPMNRPRKPMVLTPPTSPKNVGRNGSLIGPPTSRGLSVLSTMKSSTVPQTSRATPATCAPLPRR